MSDNNKNASKEYTELTGYIHNFYEEQNKRKDKAPVQGVYFTSDTASKDALQESYAYSRHKECDI